MKESCPNCGQSKLVANCESITNTNVWHCPNCSYNETKDKEDLHEKIFSVPFVKIVKIEYCATVKAKDKTEALIKCQGELYEELDEEDQETLATEINYEDIIEDNLLIIQS